MTNDIIKLSGGTTETLKLNDNDLWHSSEKFNSIEKMQTKVEKNDGKFLSNHGIVQYNSITKIKLNEKSEKIFVFYPNNKGKEQELVLPLSDVAIAHEIGKFIASKTRLSESISTESKGKTLFLSALWPIGIAALTCFIAFGSDVEFGGEGSNRSARRVRSVKAIINMLHNTIGQMGIIAIGSIITLFLAYQTWSRFKNPVNDIVYQ